MSSTDADADDSQIRRRTVLKALGGAAAGVGLATGTASAHEFRFSDCEQVCTDTDGNYAVVSTETGYEARRPREPLEGVPWVRSNRYLSRVIAAFESMVTAQMPWSNASTYCYAAAPDEAVVGFITEKEYRGETYAGEGCTLYLNPNDCASAHHEGSEDVIENLDSATVGVCADTLDTQSTD